MAKKRVKQSDSNIPAVEEVDELAPTDMTIDDIEARTDLPPIEPQPVIDTPEVKEAPVAPIKRKRHFDVGG